MDKTEEIFNVVEKKDYTECTCQHGGGLDVGAASIVAVEEDATAGVIFSVVNLRLANMNCSISSWCASKRSIQCRHAVLGSGSFIFTVIGR